MVRFIPAGAIALAIAACATPQTQSPGASDSATSAERHKQQEILFKANVEAARRLAELSDGMVIKGADLCGSKTASRIGLRIWSAQAGEGKLASSLRDVYSLSDEVTVFAVGREAPAWRSGLRQGDQILAINRWPVPAGVAAFKETEAKLSGEITANKPLEISYRRAGREHRAIVAPVKACAYRVVLSDSTQINAYADGETVVVARGIVDALQKDEELALVIGHELAHNIMGHIDARQQNAVVAGVGGAIVDIAFAVVGVNTGGAFTRIGIEGGAQAFSVGFEQEADYVGLYLVALSGHNFADAPSIWRRMAVLNPSSINYGKSHPTAPERFVTLEGAVKEIQDKKARGQPLRPNLRPKPKSIPESDRVAR